MSPSRGLGDVYKRQCQIQHMEVAADENGKISSVRVHIDADMGA